MRKPATPPMHADPTAGGHLPATPDAPALASLVEAVARLTHATGVDAVATAGSTPEGWLRAALDALQEAFFIFEAERGPAGDAIDLRYRYLNAAAEQLYGRASADVLGRGLIELFPSVVELGIFACYVEPLHTGRPSSMRVPSFDENGVAGAFDVAACPFGDGVVVTAHDVTREVEAHRSLAASAALLRVTVDNTSDLLLRIDSDLRVRYINPAVVVATGMSAHEAVGRRLTELPYPSDLTRSWEADCRRVLETGASVTQECEVDLPIGHRWFETRVDPAFDESGSVANVVATSRDITSRKRTEAQLEASQALLNVVLDGSSDGTATYGPDLRFEHVNRRVAELSGIPAEAWVGQTMGELGFADADVALWTAHVRAVFVTGRPGTMQYEVDNTQGHRWYEARLSPQPAPDGSVAHVISTNRDITERVIAERALRELATHDPLTGLANRSAVVDEIARALSSARRSDRVTAVLMVDLDRFKNVNDSLGHGAGDTLLVAVANRLARSVRGGDFVGRAGGDEFVVVMRDLDDPAEAVVTAQRLVESFRSPFVTPVGELFATASIGIAVATESSQPGDLLREADTAMYVAKGDGRDGISVFNEELRAAVTSRLAIEVDLRHGLERNQLEVWYQPEVDLKTGAVVAAEALLRWRHPSGEMWTAERFVDVAEETGLILDIGDWVLGRACAEAVTWAANGHGHSPTVRVNLSALQLAEAGLLPSLDQALLSSSLDPARLCLEITETTLLRETAVSRDNLAGIHDRGVSIAIDDFGTGYASLSYLRRYPIDVLKIDRSFVMDITTNEHDHRVVGGLIALAAHLGLRVTAEGVENEAQAAALRDLGCPGAQGYLYSQAVPATEMAAVVGTVYPHARP